MIDFIIVSETKFETTIDQRVFSQDVIFKSINWFIGDYNFYFDSINEYILKLSIELKNSDVVNNSVEFKNKLNFYLNDYKTRETILNQTKNIRDILMVKAFSSIIEFNENIITDEKSHDING